MNMPLTTPARLPFLPPRADSRRNLPTDPLRQMGSPRSALPRLALLRRQARPERTGSRVAKRSWIWSLGRRASGATSHHARRSTPRRAAPQFTFKPEWRHPLIEQFGKEGYNVLAELKRLCKRKRIRRLPHHHRRHGGAGRRAVAERGRRRFARIAAGRRTRHGHAQRTRNCARCNTTTATSPSYATARLRPTATSMPWKP